MAESDSAPKSPTQPAATRFDLRTWFSNLNNLITTFGAVLAAVAAIFSTINKSKIERIDTKVKDLDLRTKTEQSSRDYADLFIKQLLSEESIKKSEKRVQALLSVLNIVAQASGSDEGASRARTRAMTPVVLALLLGEPGGVAQMDEDYEYLDDWVAIACADDSPKTRITAIQALGGMCQKALRAGRLDVVVKGVRAVDQLLALIPKPQDAKDPGYISVLAARSQLASFIKKEDRLVDLAKDPDTKAALGDPVALRAEIRAAFSDATAVVQETKAKLEDAVKNLESKTDPAQNTAEARTLIEAKGSLAQLDAALVNASQVAISQMAPNPALKASPATSGSFPPTTPAAVDPAIKTLIKNLMDKEPQVRRQSRAQLGLLGQAAVKPLLEEVAARSGKNSEDDYKLRLGVAEALYPMTQPIVLDQVDAYWVVSLLRSNDGDTRRPAAEFLMNLESGKSIQNCFDELEKLFYELSTTPKHGNTVINAAVIVATWARNISPQTASHIPGLSMPELALQTARRWKDQLKNTKEAGDWARVTNALDELIARAEAAQNKTNQPPR
jgi:cell division protein FtsL